MYSNTYITLNTALGIKVEKQRPKMVDHVRALVYNRFPERTIDEKEVMITLLAEEVIVVLSL